MLFLDGGVSLTKSLYKHMGNDVLFWLQSKLALTFVPKIKLNRRMHLRTDSYEVKQSIRKHNEILWPFKGGIQGTFY